MWCGKGDDGGDVMLLLGVLDKMQILAFLDVAVVDDDDRCAALDLLAKLRIVLLLNFEKGVRLVGQLPTRFIRCLRVFQDI